MVCYSVDTFIDNSGDVAIEQTKENSKSINWTGIWLCSVIHILPYKFGFMSQRWYEALAKKNKKHDTQNSAFDR